MRLGHLAAEALDDARGHADEALRLVLVEAGRADDLLDLERVGDGQVLRRRVAGEECGRDHVHPLVGALGRQDRGGEQLVGVAVVERAQLARGARVLAG